MEQPGKHYLVEIVNSWTNSLCLRYMNFQSMGLACRKIPSILVSSTCY